MSKFVNNTQGNQEKTVKQVLKSVQELKTEMEVMKKTQTDFFPLGTQDLPRTAPLRAGPGL